MIRNLFQTNQEIINQNGIDMIIVIDEKTNEKFRSDIHYESKEDHWFKDTTGTLQKWRQNSYYDYKVKVKRSTNKYIYEIELRRKDPLWGHFNSEFQIISTEKKRKLFVENGMKILLINGTWWIPMF